MLTHILRTTDYPSSVEDEVEQLKEICTWMKSGIYKSNRAHEILYSIYHQLGKKECPVELMDGLKYLLSRGVPKSDSEKVLEQLHNLLMRHNIYGDDICDRLECFMNELDDAQNRKVV